MADEHRGDGQSRHQGQGHVRRGPGVAVGADEGVDDAEETGGSEGQACPVEATGRSPRFLDPPDDREDGEADGHVEPEDPLPRRPLGDGAADEGTERHGETGDVGPW